MAKIIKYKYLLCTGEGSNIVQIIFPAEIICHTQAQYDANYPIAEKEALPGTIEVSGEFDPEPETPETGDMVTWSELNGAYEAGYDEGYTEGVNSAYD